MKVKSYLIKDLDSGVIYEFTDLKKAQEQLLNCPNHTFEESYINIYHYIEIGLLNKKGQEFEKGFDDLKSATIFLNKLRRGNSLRITSIMCPDDSILNVLNYYSKELK